MKGRKCECKYLDVWYEKLRLGNGGVREGHSGAAGGITFILVTSLLSKAVAFVSRLHKTRGAAVL